MTQIPQVSPRLGVPNELVAGTRTLYVNHGTGDDNAVGDSGNPLATLQHAVNLFKRAHEGIPHWALNDDRIIIVQDPGGTSKFAESLLIPPHAGLGALIIRAVVTTHEAGLVTTGSAFTAIPGFEIRMQMNFTTSPLTANDPLIMDKAFAIPQVNVNGNPFEATWDYLPIVDNAVDSVDVTVLDPGALTAFSAGNGKTYDIEIPFIVWQPDANDPFTFVPGACIRNMGGALVVEGFKFQPNGTGQHDSVIHAVGAYGDEVSGSPVVVAKSVIETNPDSGNSIWRMISSGDSLQFNGVIFDKGAGASLGPTLSSIRAASMVNCRAIVSIFNVTNTAVTFWGLDLDANFLLVENSTMGRLYADIRNGQLRCSRSRVKVFAASVEGAGGNACMFAEKSSEIDVQSAASASRLVGTTGNTGVGLEVRDMCLASSSDEANITMSGSGGDVKVGDLAPRAWTAGAETDASVVARFDT